MKKIRILLIFTLIIEIAHFFYTETNNIVIENREINDVELSQVFKGITVMQISDLHIERIGAREKKLIELVNKLAPDIIFITGDFVSTNNGIKPCIEVLKDIIPGHIIIATLGNSDHSYKKNSIDTKLLVQEMKKVGVNILINESVRLTIAENNFESAHNLFIVGIDDNYLWLDNIFKAMNNLPLDAPKILLAHSPHIIEKINTTRINLILSGHTHGGQIVFPFIGALFTNPTCNARKKFVSGLYQEDTMIYVNRGIGIVVIPLRLFAKPEITLLKFK